MNNFIEEIIRTERKYECDVCVCGGGVAGIAAAISAAREGADVILVERSYMLGGLATAGIVTIYLPLCDGEGRQVSFGIAEELLRLSIKDGAEGRYPKAWLEGGTPEEKRAKRFEVQFNPQLFAINAEKLLLGLGVKILYGAVAVAVPTKDGRITDVVIEGKSGREAVAVSRSVVDATGDADICKLSGAKTAEFSHGNLLAAWYYSYGGGQYKLNMRGVCDVPDEDRRAGKVPPTLINRRFRALETEELSEMMQMSHASVLADVHKARVGVPDLVPTTIPTIPQVRMTRRLEGAYTQGEAEMHKRFDDSVGLFSDWRKRGPVYELPFRTLYGKEVKNLAVAGRCISVTDALWDITRVIPTCAVTGEAAGIAASICTDFSKIDIKELQKKLCQNGVKLHTGDVLDK